MRKKVNLHSAICEKRTARPTVDDPDLVSDGPDRWGYAVRILGKEMDIVRGRKRMIMIERNVFCRLNCGHT